MKKLNAYNRLALFNISMALFMVSCSEEFVSPPNLDQEILPPVTSEIEEPLTPDSSQRVVTYDLSGNFSGKVDIMFLSSEEFTPPNQIIGAQIPWDTNFSIPENTQAIGGFINGLYSDGVQDETASLKMFLDGFLIENVIRVADKDGFITLPLEAYHLEFDDSQNTISPQNIGMQVSYVVDGNALGILNLMYRIADGSKENILIDKEDLPWTYTYVTTVDSNKASILGPGLTGELGQTLTLSIYVDGVLVETITNISSEDGTVSNSEILVNFE